MLTNILDVAEVANENLLIEGLHGIGKTKIVEKWAKDKGYFIKDLLLSQTELGELIGLPENITNAEVVTYSTPQWLHEMNVASKEGKKCVLFLDEINRGTMEAKNACFQLVLDKRLFNHTLPEGTIVIAAANPAEGGNYQVDDNDPALDDRFMIVEFKANAKEWVSWARQNGIHPSVIDYINTNPEDIHTFERSDERICATPRSWEKVSDLLYAVEKTGADENALILMINGRVGASVGTKFVNFYKNFVKTVSYDAIKDVLTYNFEDDKVAVKELIDGIDEEQEVKLLDLAYSNEDTYAYVCVMQNLKAEKVAAHILSLEKDAYIDFAFKIREVFTQYSITEESKLLEIYRAKQEGKV